MPRQRHQYYCQRAADLATKSTMQHRHGCVIVYNDREIIAQGYNHTRCTMEQEFSVHAEVEAINKFRQLLKTKSRDFLSKCTLYVVRIGKDTLGQPLMMSAPCSRCTNVIHRMGIPKVVYSTCSSSYSPASSSLQPLMPVEKSHWQRPQTLVTLQIPRLVLYIYLPHNNEWHR